MNPVDYDRMTDHELKRYFLSHREDEAALRAYLDRVGDRPKDVITTVDAPDFGEKIRAAVLKQLATNINGESSLDNDH